MKKPIKRNFSNRALRHKSWPIKSLIHFSRKTITTPQINPKTWWEAIAKIQWVLHLVTEKMLLCLSNYRRGAPINHPWEKIAPTWKICGSTNSRVLTRSSRLRSKMQIWRKTTRGNPLILSKVHIWIQWWTNLMLRSRTSLSSRRIAQAWTSRRWRKVRI